MLSRFRADRGSVTAEFAIALPAVVAVLALCLSGLQIVGQQVRLQDATAAAARAAARGDPTAALARLVPGATATTRSDSDLTCVTATTATAFFGLTLTATSCALSGGR